MVVLRRLQTASPMSLRTDTMVIMCSVGWNFFPLEQLYILVAEDLWSLPKKNLEELGSWLGAVGSVPNMKQETNTSRDMVPRSQLMSRIVHGSARWLRDRDLHFAVNAGKSWGLKGLVFQKAGWQETRVPALDRNRELELRRYYSEQCTMGFWNRRQGFAVLLVG
jgi:hypothetical protein